MNEKKKPKYGMISCIGFMVKQAFIHEPLLLLGGLAMTILLVLKNLINLYLSPMVLQAVEEKVPAGQLIRMILVFIGALIVINGVHGYIQGIHGYREITLRAAIDALIAKKCALTSYCHFENKEFITLKENAGECTRYNSSTAEAIWDTLFSFIRSIAGFIIYVLLLTNVEPLLLFTMLLTTIPGYLINQYISGWGYRHRDEEAKINLAIGGSTLAGGRDAAKDVRIFGMRSWFDGMYVSAMRALHAFHMRAARVYIWSNLIELVLTFLRNGIAYFYLIQMVLNGSITAAEFLLYFTAVGGFTDWVWGILSDFIELRKQCLDLSSVLEFLHYPEPYKFEDGNPVPCENNQPAEICLNNVFFRYPGADEFTLKNINLTLRPGERLAIVGLNGAGKTTLIKLLSGLYDPTKGCVTWNGIDIRTLNRRDYYQKFSAIFQELTIIPGSLAVNVAASETEIDMEKVRRCVTQADLKKKFEDLPDAYETTLNREVYEDAVELSGGELQRLILARALYKDAPILLLDEPTAALDPIAESQIYQKYNEMTSGKSAVYISHRLASTRFCDRIILLENNTIAEEGTHSELIARNGRYAELFEVQSRYYREDFQPEKEA